MAKKDNSSAKELWEQVFARDAKAENAALIDADYDPSEDEAKMVKALQEAGWPQDHIDMRLELSRSQDADAPITSPGVNPAVERQLGIICADIEAAMKRMKLDSHSRVAIGVEPRAWASASKINVMLTEESIITVSAFLFRFCGLIARAFTRTLLLDPYCWDAKRFDERSVRGRLLADQELLRYWMRIYFSFAVTGTHINVPYKPAKPHELILFEQVARAMEIFAIAHEYGHHHHAHGKHLESDPHKEEFEADQFALRIGYEVERYPFICENPYLASGAGGVILLIALRALREIEIALGLRRGDVLDTHPEIGARIARFNTVALLCPGEFQVLNNFRTAAGRVFRVVHSILLPSLTKPSPDIVKGMAEFRKLRD